MEEKNILIEEISSLQEEILHYQRGGREVIPSSENYMRGENL